MTGAIIVWTILILLIFGPITILGISCAIKAMLKYLKKKDNNNDKSN